MYHSIGGDGELSVSPSRLREQLQFFQRYYSIVDLPQAVGTDDPKTVALSFDDGLANFVDVALPILREFDAPVTAFVVTASIYEDGQYLPSPTMTVEDLEEIADDPLVTIGNHTRTHHALPELEQEEQRDEILGAKRILEDELGIRVRRFAYPGGAFDDHSVELVCESHDFGVTVESPFRIAHTDWTLPRLHAHSPPSRFRWPLTSFGHLYHDIT